MVYPNMTIHWNHLAARTSLAKAQYIVTVWLWSHSQFGLCAYDPSGFDPVFQYDLVPLGLSLVHPSNGCFTKHE